MPDVRPDRYASPASGCRSVMCLLVPDKQPLCKASYDLAAMVPGPWRLNDKESMTVPLTFQALQDFVDTATHPHALSPVFRRFARQHGFRHHAYLSLQTTEIRYFGDYPTSWKRFYLAERLDRLDPVIARARQCKSPFTWSVLDWIKGSKDQLETFAANAVDHGVMHGMTISARASFDTQLILTFSGHMPTGQLKAKELSEAVPLLMGLHYRLSPLLQPHPISNVRPLSSRELLCLNWAAKGKLAPETAVITGLSPRTVQHYLDSARDKLGAVNICQLVAIGKDLKLI